MLDRMGATLLRGLSAGDHARDYGWSISPKKRSFDALPFKPFERSASRRPRFAQNVWILGTKNVRQKTHENLGRLKPP